MPKRACLFLTTFFALSVLIASVIFVIHPTQVFAQEDNSAGIRSDETLTQPKERVVNVTASVNDSTPPSVPILISPSNDTITSDTTPTFIWKGSTDAFGIDHYVLTIDGSTLFDNIPITATENSQYILTYDSTTEYYSLTPKSAIADGTHTWKITAVDPYTNTASSVTWTFTIDSQSPVFVITKIDEIEQSISAQDTSTVPTDPIELTNNEPILSGTGEANSSVELTVTLSDGTITSYTFTISSSATWEVQLGVLPRDSIVYLDFRITDQVGHISVIDNVPLILKTPVISIPTIPLLPPPEKPLEIPLPPPKELLPEIVKEVIPPKLATLMGYFPIVSPTPREVVTFKVVSILVLLLIILLPFLKTLILAGQFGSEFALNTLPEIWKAIGLMPWSKPHGIVVYQSTQDPVPFAKLSISGRLDTYRRTTHTRLTNMEGLYSCSNLQTGSYQINVTHPTALFPTLVKKYAHLAWQQYYQGQEFVVDAKNAEPNLIIPVDHIKKESSWGSQFNWWLLTRPMANLPTLSIALLITIFASSYVNIAATIFYSGCIVFVKSYFWKQKLSGKVITIHKKPIVHAIIMAFNQEATKLLGITQTDNFGNFTTRPHEQKLTLTMVDFSYKLATSSTTELPANAIDINTTQTSEAILIADESK